MKSIVFIKGIELTYGDLKKKAFQAICQIKGYQDDEIGKHNRKTLRDEVILSLEVEDEKKKK